jgi:UDP-N-acetylmuramoyl-tripeptide--D-alanyl-D-alanine ligase
MGTWTVPEVLEATGGKLVSGSRQTSFTGITTDSRTIKAGELFCALKGAHFDGHHFLWDALQRGARGVLVSTSAVAVQEQGHCQIVVDDTLTALGDLARYHRRRFRLAVVGITGSNGKTTTKEMTAQVLAQVYPVLKSPENQNNLIGLPLTLLRLEPYHRVAVVEMGTNMPGEIAQLAGIAKATIGVLTNIHQTHLALLGSVQRIREEKGKLLESLEEQGIAVLNADDKEVRTCARLVRGKVLTFGLGSDADVRGDQVECCGVQGVSFQLAFRGEHIPVHLPTLGIHNVYNGLAAAAVALCLDCKLPQIREGLQRYTPVPRRMEQVRLEEGVLVLNDSYNANPTSLRAAIAVLATLPKPNKHLLVVGDMLELGAEEQRLHQELGRDIASSTVDWMITVGSRAVWIAEGAWTAGMPRDHVLVCADHAEALQRLSSLLAKGDTVLIKGSRGMQMWKITETLVTRRKVV